MLPIKENDVRSIEEMYEDQQAEQDWGRPEPIPIDENVPVLHHSETCMQIHKKLHNIEDGKYRGTMTQHVVCFMYNEQMKVTYYSPTGVRSLESVPCVITVTNGVPSCSLDNA